MSERADVDATDLAGRKIAAAAVSGSIALLVEPTQSVARRLRGGAVVVAMQSDCSNYGRSLVVAEIGDPTKDGEYGRMQHLEAPDHVDPLCAV